jgi:hypothetical protein
MSRTSIRQALQHVANSPDPRVRGSSTRANKARKQILDRMDGKRRTGTTPPVHDGRTLEFFDMTGGEISAPASATQD